MSRALALPDVLNVTQKNRHTRREAGPESHYYVENWSLALDLSIVARTAAAVVKSSGAY